MHVQPARSPRSRERRSGGAAKIVPAFLALALAACGADYDLVLQGGRVMDPASGLDAVRNVGIRAGRVAAVSEEPLEGGRTIDVTGLVVAPGFIDLHRHGHDEAGYRLQIQDGVTTGLELELGTHDVAGWYAEREDGQLANYGVAVGHLGSRAVSMGDPEKGIGGRSTRRAATPVEEAETERLLRVGLAEGAIGIGFGAAYTPGASMDELERMLAVAAERGVAAFVHIRGGLAGLDSIVEAAGRVGSALHVVHANSSAGSAIRPFLARIEAARAEGLDVTTESYPYAASQTLVQSAPFDGWEAWPEERFGRYALPGSGERLTKERFAALRARGGSVIIHGRTDELTRAAVTSPLTMVASDGGGRHPRGAGTFARILGRYVREEGALDLMDALSRMTIRPARRLEPFVPAMALKGRLQVGADADLTVFDPETVIDRATYENGRVPSAGFRYVLVAGVVVLEDGEIVEGGRPGRAITSRPTY
jgi:N-acyl-D-aspartate/D-glutamate deacylase